MARRRTKKRTQKVDPNGSATARKASQSPKSMVIRIGASEVGPSVSQLVKDVRQMMEPETASRLKERRKNKLRDYLSMCGPLGVSHLLLFSKSESGNTNLRIAVTPRGPTLHFQVENYSLCKDVMKALKHPKGGGKEYITPPLLVMNNFTASTTPEQNGEVKSVPRHLQSLTTTVFQSLFPPISPQSTPLTSIRRVLLLNREPVVSEDDPSYTIHLRHYAITTKSTGLSRPIRRLNAAERLIQSRKSRKGGLPNLHQMDDIADYMVGGDGSGYVTDATSGSEVDTDAEVEVMETRVKKIAGKRQRQQGQSRKDGGIGVQKKAVKLVELGPRMKLRLVKVEEGVCAGKVMWHEFISKSREEEQKMERLWETRTAEKEERRRIQRQNVERKKAKRGDAKGDDEAQGEGDGEGEGEEESEMDIDEWDDDLGEESEMDVEE